ncbi:MAG: NgoFVII family restriction endonuclease [Bacteroides sp.]|nr:NgoFVII family restriction endonuclease [Bacteroides sp.]
MKSVEVNLFDRNGDIQYGLNWGNRDNRDRNEAYLQLSPDVYKSNFFPEKGIYFVVETDDNETLIMNRAQKGVGTAIQTPENNATLGLYIRKRLGIPSGTEITVNHLKNSNLTKFIFTKIDDKHFRLSTNTLQENNDIISLDLESTIKNADDNTKRQFDYLRAMRTKPFLLLAGISGTGKSRIVKQMAFDSCPDNAELRSDPTSPGNYCLIEVKPNWHDSTELLGYESKIGGAHYQLTTFVKFLIKAMLHPNVPFFVCLDEMNLAPVEQYFAEFLSVLESRTKLEDGHIVSEPLIKADIFANKDYELKLQDDLFGLELKEEINKDGSQRIISGKLPDEMQPMYEALKKHGLRIPENVVVIGTVNMDETTHQFSRKVIDRAMTIEMNLPEGDPFMDFFTNASDLSYRTNPTSASLYLATETKAKDVIKDLSLADDGKTKWLKGEIAGVLTRLNDALDGTPFKVAYRVQNELLLYFYQMWRENKSAKWKEILYTSVDQILMMKVLPRVEGDEELLEGPLKRLIEFAAPYPNAKKKLDEMKKRLEQSRFTSFWP